jgi:phospholipase C
MKLAAKNLLFLIALATTLAHAQNPNTPIKHVIMVIQENRTPDNLFGSDAVPVPGPTHQLPGADLAVQGNCHGTKTNLQPWELNACFDPDHGHGWNHPKNDSWIKMYDQGQMDGACDIHLVCTSCPNNGHCPTLQNPQQTYVDNSNLTVQPYFDIAKNYGFANYMFQTSQGPSFEAHQFLFTGTSAPTPSNDTTDQCYDSVNKQYYPCYQWFAVENQQGAAWGCLAGNVSPIANIVEISPGPTNPGPGGNEFLGIYKSGYPCYEHNTLADLLDQNHVSWRYYPQGPSPQLSLWTAPNAINHICVPTNYPTPLPQNICTGTDWVNYVQPEIPPTPPVSDAMAPILENIENCNLPAVSWVIPDGTRSDHPGSNSHIKGPAWVAAVVNAVGNSWTQSKGGGVCDYWGSTQHTAEPTAILIVWDDWGGFYDHILPWNCASASKGGKCSGYPDGNAKWYVYGFRVPLLVVSAYNYRPSGSTGYISGVCGQPGQPSCPNEQQQYIHDFGSILNFTEYVFGTGGNSLGEIDPYGYHYADHWAPDAFPSCPKATCPYSLSDFFNFNQSPTPFATIQLPPVLCNNQVCYNAEWSENFNGTPTDPDDDAID